MLGLGYMGYYEIMKDKDNQKSLKPYVLLFFV